jgi:hypothetical protein
MLPLYTQTFVAPAEVTLIYNLKLFCKNISDFYEYFLTVLPFGGYYRKLFPSKPSRRKKSQGLRSGERSAHMPLLIILWKSVLNGSDGNVLHLGLVSFWEN